MAPLEYRGQSDVMLWCGVTRPAVSNWISRHPDTVPQPDVIIVSEDSSRVIRGWLPERREEWEKFAAARKADRAAITASAATRSAASRRAQNTAALIRESVAAGRIEAAEAVALLAELIGQPDQEGS